ALPLFLPLSSLGGIAVRWLRMRNTTANASSLLGIILLGPYLLAPAELQLPAAEAIRTVENTIVVDADAQTVWANITNVTTIAPHEQRRSPFHRLGLPKPLKAVMTDPGPDGIRYGYFEEGLIF